MGIIEVMISVAISASLLLAVAAAFKASSDAINRNDEYFRCSQAGRIALNQMLTEIRRADAVQVTGTTAVDVIRPSQSRLQLPQRPDRIVHRACRIRRHPLAGPLVYQPAPESPIVIQVTASQLTRGCMSCARRDEEQGRPLPKNLVAVVLAMW